MQLASEWMHAVTVIEEMADRYEQILHESERDEPDSPFLANRTRVRKMVPYGGASHQM